MHFDKDYTVMLITTVAFVYSDLHKMMVMGKDDSLKRSRMGELRLVG